MNIRARSKGFAVGLTASFAIFAGAAQAKPQYHYWPIQETQPSGQVRFKVIEEDESLRANQNQLSERVIYDQTLAPNQVPTDTNAFVKALLAKTPNLQDYAQAFPRTGLPLWTPAKPAWTEGDEDAYSKWFASIDTTFSVGSALLADCADTGLLFRWVYARNNLLPIANTMVSGKLFGHFSSNAAWDALPTNVDWKKDERFKAAMHYLFNNTYTRTVVKDLFPTLVNSSYVRPGSMFMIIRPTDGHTQTIHEVSPTLGIYTYWGNEPAAEAIYESPIIIETQNKLTIGMWRQVRTSATGDWELTPPEQMPGYSLAQFAQTFNSGDAYTDWLDEQIGVTVSNSAKLEDLRNEFLTNIDKRIQATIRSVPFCVNAPCAPGSVEFQNDSTATTDALISLGLKQIASLLQIMGPRDSAVVSFISDITSWGEIIRGSGLTYLSLVQNPALIATFSSDPRVPFETRWRLTPGPDMNFYSDAYVLNSLLADRENLVNEAYALCANGCDLNSAAVIALNTTTLDAGIKTVYQSVSADISASGVSASTSNFIQNYFSQESLEFADLTCSNPANCSFKDVVFGPAAQARELKWLPNADAAIKARWGF